LLEAAVRAPTAIHQEPWGFVVIQDKKLLQTLSDQAKPMFVDEIHHQSPPHTGHTLDIFNKPDFNIFYNAGTLILICGKADAPYFTADCWLAAENFMLAACAMGLGTCVIGSALPALNLVNMHAQLGIPDNFSVVAPIVVGYPDDEIAPILRKNPIVLTNIPASLTAKV
jgi:nitroreductase